MKLPGIVCNELTSIAAPTAETDSSAQERFEKRKMDPLLKKLTIGIPVYNEKKFILQTLESCVLQAGTILISDNCSTDGTSDICEEFANSHSNVFYTRNDSNIGMLENFKRPLFQCETEYFQWLGAHDILDKNYTLPLLEAAEQDASLTRPQDRDRPRESLARLPRISNALMPCFSNAAALPAGG